MTDLEVMMISWNEAEQTGTGVMNAVVHELTTDEILPPVVRSR